MATLTQRNLDEFRVRLEAFELRQQVRHAATELGLPGDVAITITSSGESDTADEPEEAGDSATPAGRSEREGE